MRIRLICAGMLCGEVRVIDMKQAIDPDDTTLVCPKCGNCTWYIEPYNDNNEKIKDWNTFKQNHPNEAIQIE